MWNRGPFMTSISKIQNIFKVIYRDQTIIETFALLAICISKRSNPILQLIFQNSRTFFFWRHYLQIGWKGHKVVCHVSQVIEKSKSIFNGTLKWRDCFWDHIFKISQFWLSWWRYWLKNRSKRFKLVLHVSMVMERWKSKVKVALTWILLKIWIFDST